MITLDLKTNNEASTMVPTTKSTLKVEAETQNPVTGTSTIEMTTLPLQETTLETFTTESTTEAPLDSEVITDSINNEIKEVEIITLDLKTNNEASTTVPTTESTLKVEATTQDPDTGTSTIEMTTLPLQGTTLETFTTESTTEAPLNPEVITESISNEIKEVEIITLDLKTNNKASTTVPTAQSTLKVEATTKDPFTGTSTIEMATSETYTTVMSDSNALSTQLVMKENIEKETKFANSISSGPKMIDKTSAIVPSTEITLKPKVTKQDYFTETSTVETTTMESKDTSETYKIISTSQVPSTQDDIIDDTGGQTDQFSTSPLKQQSFTETSTVQPSAKDILNYEVTEKDHLTKNSTTMESEITLNLSTTLSTLQTQSTLKTFTEDGSRADTFSTKHLTSQNTIKTSTVLPSTQTTLKFEVPKQDSSTEISTVKSATYNPETTLKIFANVSTTEAPSDPDVITENISQNVGAETLQLQLTTGFSTRQSTTETTMPSIETTLHTTETALLATETALSTTETPLKPKVNILGSDTEAATIKNVTLEPKTTVRMFTVVSTSDAPLTSDFINTPLDPKTPVEISTLVPTTDIKSKPEITEKGNVTKASTAQATTLQPETVLETTKTITTLSVPSTSDVITKDVVRETAAIDTTTVIPQNATKTFTLSSRPISTLKPDITKQDFETKSSTIESTTSTKLQNSMKTTSGSYKSLATISTDEIPLKSDTDAPSKPEKIEEIPLKPVVVKEKVSTESPVLERSSVKPEKDIQVRLKSEVITDTESIDHQDNATTSIITENTAETPAIASTAESLTTKITTLQPVTTKKITTINNTPSKPEVITEGNVVEQEISLETSSTIPTTETLEKKTTTDTNVMTSTIITTPEGTKQSHSITTDGFTEVPEVETTTKVTISRPFEPEITTRSVTIDSRSVETTAAVPAISIETIIEGSTTEQPKQASTKFNTKNTADGATEGLSTLIPAKETTQEPVVITYETTDMNTESPTRESAKAESEATVQTTEPKDEFSTASTAVPERTPSGTAIETNHNNLEEVVDEKSTTDSNILDNDATTTKKLLKTTGIPI